MDLLNGTKMKAGYTMGIKPDGREALIVVVKGTFTVPSSPSGTPELASEQAELIMADEFTREPGLSAPRYESDFALFKPRCDVLLNGSSYAPDAKPVRRLKVGLRVGSMEKTFSVVGNRFWRKWLCFIWNTNPLPFVKMPISYDNAFGGADIKDENPKKHSLYSPNPAGKGYHRTLSAQVIDRKPLPNTERIGQRVRWPRSHHSPMAFGPIGRGWRPRPRFAGTYDKNWLENIFPFLPPDFDARYFQCAPPDQQIDHLRGGEKVELLNLTPQGRTQFQLPKLVVPITFYRKSGEETAHTGINDTLIIEPDLNRIILVWRTHLPLRKSIFEVAQVVIGSMPRAWHRARVSGKRWFPSLKERVEAGAETEDLEEAIV